MDLLCIVSHNKNTFVKYIHHDISIKLYYIDLDISEVKYSHFQAF